VDAVLSPFRDAIDFIVDLILVNIFLAIPDLKYLFSAFDFNPLDDFFGGLFPDVIAEVKAFIATLRKMLSLKILITVNDVDAYLRLNVLRLPNNSEPAAQKRVAAVASSSAPSVTFECPQKYYPVVGKCTQGRSALVHVSLSPTKISCRTIVTTTDELFLASRRCENVDLAQFLRFPCENNACTVALEQYIFSCLTEPDEEQTMYMPNLEVRTRASLCPSTPQISYLALDLHPLILFPCPSWNSNTRHARRTPVTQKKRRLTCLVS
jgi:hypothetical protein